MIFVYVQTIPCNVRREFNRNTGNSVEFQALGRTYVVDVRKERAITRLAGSAWRRFITQNRIPAGVYLYFAMRGAPGPRINVLYFNDNEESDNEESGDEESDNEEGGDDEGGDDEGGDDEEQGPLDSAMIAQRCKLTDSEEQYLINNYPPMDSFIGLSLVTRLTMTHIELHDMVCFHLPFFIHFLLYSYCVMVHIEISNFCILETTVENGFFSSYS